MLLNLNKSSELINFLTYNQIPYVSYSTMSSKRIDSGGYQYYLSDLRLTSKELGFLSTVRKDARNFVNKNGEKQIDRKGIHYTMLQNLLPGHYNNIVEIDISAAYWNCAYQLGIIETATYEKGLTLSKSARLVALGSLASSKAVFRFNGKDLKYIGENKNLKLSFKPDSNEFEIIGESDKKDQNLNWLFFWISNEIGYVVRDVYNTLNGMKKDGCIGFWIDAVFVDRELVFDAIDIINYHGYDCKIKGVTSVNCITRDFQKTIWMTERTAKLACENLESTTIRVKPFIVEEYKKAERQKRQQDRIIQETLKVINKFR